MTDPEAFVCQVDALDPSEHARRKDLAAELARASAGRIELGDGWLFQLTPDADVFQAAAEWMAYESRCCPFLHFVLEWRGDSRIGLRVTGGPGAKAFIADTFASLAG